MSSESDKYILATDNSAQQRLRLLQSVYGPSTEALLNSIGISPGMRAVDFGCGIGSVTQILARLSGPHGHATGVDMSREHLATAARDATASQVTNVSWYEGSAYGTKLPRATFDIAYCRFLLEHLTDPFAALNEMYDLLKPGGLLVCEAIDVSSLVCDPPQPAYTRAIELLIRLQTARGSDGTIGPKIHRMFRKLGSLPKVKFDQPVYLDGDGKCFWEITFRETVPAMLKEGIIGVEDAEALKDDLAKISQDDAILIAHARKVQTWGRK